MLFKEKVLCQPRDDQGLPATICDQFTPFVETHVSFKVPELVELPPVRKISLLIEVVDEKALGPQGASCMPTIVGFVSTWVQTIPSGVAQISLE